MKLRSTLIVLAAICMLTGFQTNINTVFPQEIETKTVTKEDLDKTESKKDTTIIKDEPETSYKLKKGAVIVRVKTICDAKYRKLHPKDWKARAKKATKEATKSLYSNFNISFTVKKPVSGTMISNKDANKIYARFAKKYKVKKCEMVVGFSGNKPLHGTGRSAVRILGIAYMGKVSGGPRPLVFAGTYNSEVETVQHEIGHTYNLSHCNSICVMTSSGLGYVNHFCVAHKKQWKNNRKYYKK